MYELAKIALRHLLDSSKREVKAASDNHKIINERSEPAHKKQREALLHAHIARHNALIEFIQKFELERAGCKCSSPLLGYRSGKGPRCRLCGCEVETEFDYGKS